jgi:hypothetical protein
MTDTDFLKMYTTEHLKKVVADREAAEEEAKHALPVPLKKPHYGRILASVERHIKYLASADYHDDNNEVDYIYEDVMKAMYGNDIFDWINR